MSQTKFGIKQGRLAPPEDGRFQSFPQDQSDVRTANKNFAGAKTYQE
jgi:hypothetical protein